MKNRRVLLSVLVVLMLSSLACNSFNLQVFGVDVIAYNNGSAAAPQGAVAAEEKSSPSVLEPAAETAQAEINGTTSYADGGITLIGFPSEAHPVRWGETIQPAQKCSGPMVNWIFCDPGVLSFDYANGHDEKNPSAVWSGGAQVDNLMENQVGDYSCPESGYVKVTLPNADMTWKHPVTGETMLLSLKAQPGTSYTVVFQCAYDGEGDRSVKIHFTTDENGAGNVKVMRYPVEAKDSGFYSLTHILEDLKHSRKGTDNCGNDGCPHNILIAVGMNEATYGIWNFNGTGLDLVQTNAIKPQ